MSIEELVKEAEEIFGFLIDEFDAAKREHDELRARQVCEKAYLILVKTANATLIKKGIGEEEIPKTERGRHYFIRRHTDKEFQRSFAILRQHFHLDGFFDGIIIFEQLEEDIDELKSLLEKLKDRGKGEKE